MAKKTKNKQTNSKKQKKTKQTNGKKTQTDQ